MAKCPHCDYKLKIIDIKAECPVCGVNIPNYNWEERLDLDAANAERSFSAFRRKTGAFKNALFGSKLRIARFVLTFAPLLFFLFPMFTYETFLPFEEGKNSLSMLNLILDTVNGKLDIGSLLGFVSMEKSGMAFTVFYASIVLVLLGIVAGVLNFFVIILSGFGYHAKLNIALCVTSFLTFAAAAVLIAVSGMMFAKTIPELFSLNLSYSLFIGMAFFVVNITLNSITEKHFKPLRKQMIEAELEETKKYEEELAAI